MSRLQSAPSGRATGPSTARSFELEAYLKDVTRHPLLSAEDQRALARTLREETARFRSQLGRIPGASRRAVALWKSRVAKGRVTATLSESYRDQSGRDHSAAIDRSLGAIEKLLARRDAKPARERRALDEELAQALAGSDLSMKVLVGIFEELEDELRALDAAPARSTERRRIAAEVGLPARAFRERMEEVRRTLAAADSAKQEAVSRNLRLVISVAKRFQGSGIALADLVQEGNLGLIRAVEKFDERRGFKFSTYAVWWISQACIRAIQHSSRTVRMPAHVYELLLRRRRMDADLTSRLGREPTRQELAHALDVGVEVIDQLENWSRHEVSLERPVQGAEDVRLEDVLPDDEILHPSDRIEALQFRAELPRLLERLTPREREVIAWHYGLRDGDGVTLAKVGERLGISRERARQIKVQALDKLAKQARAHGPDLDLAAAPGA